MKKKIALALLLMIACGDSFELIGQCDSDHFSNACIPKLAEGFNFLKSYKIDGEGKHKIEYSYVFTKGTQYMINLCTGGTGLIVSLFDSARNKVATSKVNGEHTTAIVYPCNATGIYYIEYSFDGATTKCGGSALGFKR
jgi:hypothetical protein